MRLIRLKSRGFGCLPDGFEWLFRPTGLTVIVGHNEQGKSTLVQALLAGLYGEPLSAKESKRFRQMYSPWTHPEQGPRLALEVEANDGRHLTIYRDFDSKASPVRVQAEPSREDLTRQFQVDKKTFHIAENPLLVGLSRSTFEKSALVQQNELPGFTSSPDLVQAIERIVVSGETGATAQAAMKLLDEAESSLPNPLGGRPIMAKTIISRLRDAIAEKQKDMNELQREFATFQEAFENAASLERRLKQLDVDLIAQEQTRRLAEWNRLKQQLDTFTERQSQWQDLLREIETLESYRTFPVSEHARLQEMYGQYRQIRHRLETSQIEAHTAEARLKSITDESWPELDDWLEQDYLDKSSLFQQFKGLKTSYDQIFQEWNAERERLIESGLDIARFESIGERVAQLPMDQRNDLYSQLQAWEELKRRVAEQSASLQWQGEYTGSNPRSSSFAGLWLVVGIGLAVCAAVMTLWLPMVPAFWTMVAMAGAVVSLVLFGIQWSYRKKAAGLIESEFRVKAEAHQELQHQLAQLESTLIAKFSANPTVEISDLHWFSGYQHQAFRTLDALRQTMHIREADLTGICDRLDSAFSLVPEQAGTLFDRTIRIEDCRARFEAYLSTRRQRLESLQALEHIQQRITADQAALEDCKARIREILEQAGFETPEAIEEGQSWFNDQVERAHRLKHLEGLKAEKESVLPEAQQVKTIESRLRDLEANLPEHFDGSIPPLEEAQATLDRMIVERDALKDQWHQLNSLIQRSRDKYYQEAPQVQTRLEELNALLARYEQFQKAVAVARATIETVSNQEYRQWSERLNRRVNHWLTQFHSPYRELRFTSDLAFSVLDEQDRVLHQGDGFEQLSCGARDQVYFSVRLAVTDYLSQAHGELPLILDDPFVNFDDDRFHHGMKALVEAGSAGRQIVLLTCHAQRHNWLFQQFQEEYPDQLWIEAFPTPKGRLEKLVLLEE